MQKSTNFGGLEERFSSEQSSKIVVIPVPYDATSTWIKGADKGPSAIIEASANMELYDIETDSEVYHKGIFTDLTVSESSTPEAMVKAVEQRIEHHLHNGKFPVVIGGEHSVAVGAIRAQTKKYRKITVLQLDAHADLRDQYEGSKYNHACVMARAAEVSRIVQVGTRSASSGEKVHSNSENIYFANDIYNSTDWIERLVFGLSENVYITFDLDVFDPSQMPSTGTPEPGGLMWYDVLNLLKAVCYAKNIVGFDVVELCPNPTNKAPDFLAAKLIYKTLSYIFRG